MTFASKRVIAIFKKIASHSDWPRFTVLTVPFMTELKEYRPSIFEEVSNFRRKLLIDTGNEIRDKDNCWQKIHAAFKSMNLNNKQHGNI